MTDNDDRSYWAVAVLGCTETDAYAIEARIKNMLYDIPHYKDKVGFVVIIEQFSGVSISCNEPPPTPHPDKEKNCPHCKKKLTEQGPNRLYCTHCLKHCNPQDVKE